MVDARTIRCYLQVKDYYCPISLAMELKLPLESCGESQFSMSERKRIRLLTPQQAVGH